MNWVEQLVTKGYVQIESFLDNSLANKYREGVLKCGHFKAWNILTTPYYPQKAVKDEIHKSTIDKQRHIQAVKAKKRGKFAFSFYRSNNKHETAHQNKEIHQTFAQHVIDKTAKPLNLSGEIRDSFFASFIKEQFIGYHSDGPAGRYAFIYQLSKGWQPKYGGQLELYPKRIKFYKKILEPKFNSLAILKLDHPMYHSVRILNNPAHKHRITISGWLE